MKKDYGVVIDPHTADGVRIALRHREARYPMICVETALPVKFEATIVEALGEPAPRPAGFEGIEDLPQRCDVMGSTPRPSRRSSAGWAEAVRHDGPQAAALAVPVEWLPRAASRIGRHRADVRYSPRNAFDIS